MSVPAAQMLTELTWFHVPASICAYWVMTGKVFTLTAIAADVAVQADALVIWTVYEPDAAAV